MPGRCCRHHDDRDLDPEISARLGDFTGDAVHDVGVDAEPD